MPRRVPSAEKRTCPCSARTAAAVWSEYITNATRFIVCTAPTRIPTGTPAPTNVGDTNLPTRGPTFAPTPGPNFADPTGESDAIDVTYLPSLSPFPPFLLPPPLPLLH